MTNENTETKTEDQARTNKPIHKIRVGSVQVAIWEKKGKDGLFPTATFSRSYKTKEGWKNGHSYTLAHIEDLQNAGELAKSYMDKNYGQPLKDENIPY